MMSDWFWKKLNYYIGWVALLILFGLLVFLANVEIKDLDLWLHIGTGRYILQNMAIPQIDVLSYTISGQPWINHEWFFQIIVYLFYNTGGIEGLINLNVLVIGLTFSLLVFFSFDKNRQLLPLILLLFVLLVYELRFMLRPDLFSLLFFTMFIHMMSFHLEKRGSLFLFVVIQVLWVNIHGYFIFGPVLVLLGLGAEWLKRHCRLPYDWGTTGRLTDEEYKKLKIVFIAVLLACLVNPSFIKGAMYPLMVLFSLSGDSKIFFKDIGELQKPIQWHDVFVVNEYLYYKLLILISGCSFILNRRKVDIGAVLLWGIFLVFSLSAARNIFFFAFVAYFVTMINWQYAELQFLRNVRLKSEKAKAISALLIKLLLIFWMIQYAQQNTVRGYFDFDRMERKSEFGGVSLRNYPYKAVDFLVKQNVQGRFFNDFNSGAYLVGRTHPNIKVFIDGRTEVYGAEFYKQYNKAFKGDTELFDQLVEKYQTTGVFLSHIYVPVSEKLIKHLYDSPEWVLVYFDYDASIFLKDIPYNQLWIERYEIDLKKWVYDGETFLDYGIKNVTAYRYVNRAYALLHMGFSEKAFIESENALKISPFYDEPYKILGQIYYERKDYLSAFENFRKAKLLNAGDIKVRLQLAEALFYLGRLDDAKEQLSKVYPIRPDSPRVLDLTAKIYAKENKLENSLEALKRRHSIDNDDADVVMEVAEIFSNQGMDSAAQNIYEWCLSVSPDNKQVIKKLEKIK